MKKFKFGNKGKNSIFNYVLYGIIIIGCICSLFIIIFGDKQEIIETPIDPNDIEVDIYEVKENRVLDYDTFFSIEDISKNVFKSLQDKNYSEVYNVLSNEYKEILTVEEFSRRVEEYIINIKVQNTKFTSGRLNFLYEIDKGKYLADADFLYVNNNINIIFSIYNNEYRIEYLDILRGETNE